jgi:hypothetical protein
MATPGIPRNFIAQSQNQKILLSWDLSTGADSYLLQRSLDNVTYTALATISGSPLATSYLDTAVTLGTQYWYKVAAVQGADISSYTAAADNIPVPTGELALAQIRLQSQQTADRVNSNFVTKSEWNNFINLAMDELYDLLINTFEDQYVAEPAYFALLNNSNSYTLPNGSNTFQDASGTDYIPKPFYKLLGVDLAVNTAQNAWVTINNFNFIDRNTYLYPNSTSTIYGIYNLRYRMMGNNLQLIPTPASGQRMRLWYIPRITGLLADTDTSDVSVSGWIRYVIVRAAKYALDKEESDTSKLDAELMFLTKRIEESASNRDAGNADTISNTANSNWSSGWGPGGSNGRGGF